jgi:membrane associated rhomboid family serine protease
MLLPLLIVFAIVFFVMPRQQRERLLHTAVLVAKRSKESATKADPDDGNFKDALRSRAPHIPVTLALTALNAAVFVLMLFGAGQIAAGETQIAWGGSSGPLTTNGGWWRLVTAMFVHPTVLHAAVNIAVLLQLGMILERLAGRRAFAGVYVAAGVIANLVTMWSYRVLVTVGASGAICGLYGMLAAMVFWGTRQRSPYTVPPGRLQKIGVLAALFFLFNIANGAVSFAGEITAILIGFACGIVLTRGVEVEPPHPRLIGVTLAVAAALALALAVPLRGIADVRPEITYVIDVEQRTSRIYNEASDQFKKGRMTTDAFAQRIAKAIVPELQAADKRLKALKNVPPETQPLVELAADYVKKRTESWRMRIDGLRKAEDTPRPVNTGIEPGSDAKWRFRAEAQYRANLKTLAKSESAEREALDALERLKADARAGG